MNLFVTNLTNKIIGFDGVIKLAPKEVNRAIEVNTANLRKAKFLASAHMIAYIIADGLTKNVDGTVVNTIGIDSDALSKEPRTKVKKEEPTTSASAETVESTAEVVEETISEKAEEDTGTKSSKKTKGSK